MTLVFDPNSILSSILYLVDMRCPITVSVQRLSRIHSHTRKDARRPSSGNYLWGTPRPKRDAIVCSPKTLHILKHLMYGRTIWLRTIKLGTMTQVGQESICWGRLNPLPDTRGWTSGRNFLFFRANLNQNHLIHRYQIWPDDAWWRDFHGLIATPLPGRARAGNGSVGHGSWVKWVDKSEWVGHPGPVDPWLS